MILLIQRASLPNADASSMRQALQSAAVAALSLPGRVRLGYGTSQLVKASGWEAKRVALGVHVKEIMESLESAADPEPAGRHPEYGALVRLNGVTGSGRRVSLTAHADRLPLMLVDIEVGPEAPRVGDVAA